ncbi:hypothetical protein MY11210_009199 [Beauveria gryllotalpidicola]
MPLDKKLDLGAIKSNSKEWEETYQKLGDRGRAADNILNLNKKTQEQLNASGSSARARAHKPTASLRTQQLELDLEILKVEQGFARTMIKAHEVAEHEQARESEKAKEGQKTNK